MEADALVEERRAGGSADPLARAIERAEGVEWLEWFIGCIEAGDHPLLDGVVKRVDAEGATVFAADSAKAREAASAALRHAEYASFLYALYATVCATVGVPAGVEVLGDEEWESWFGARWGMAVFADGFVALAKTRGDDSYRLLYVFELDGDRLRGVYLIPKKGDGGGSPREGGAWKIVSVHLVDAGREAARRALEELKNAMQGRGLRSIFIEWCRREPNQPRLAELLQGPWASDEEELAGFRALFSP